MYRWFVDYIGRLFWVMLYSIIFILLAAVVYTGFKFVGAPGWVGIMLMAMIAMAWQTAESRR